jgi:hypothetical protein
VNEVANNEDMKPRTRKTATTTTSTTTTLESRLPTIEKVKNLRSNKLLEWPSPKFILGTYLGQNARILIKDSSLLQIEFKFPLKSRRYVLEFPLESVAKYATVQNLLFSFFFFSSSSVCVHLLISFFPRMTESRRKLCSFECPPSLDWQNSPKSWITALRNVRPFLFSIS